VFQVDADRTAGGTGGQQGPAVAAGKAHEKPGGGTAKQVAGPAVVKLRSRAALRARIGGCQFAGVHRQDSGGEIPQRDPGRQEVPADPRILDAGSARAFGGTEESLTIRSDVGKTNGPDGDSGYGEGSAVLAVLPVL
jgi:hypothetical protein